MDNQKILQCGRHSLSLSNVQVMGILNTTPDSFSDGGQHFKSGVLSLDSVLYRAEAMLAAGANIIDVGGESTRPGAAQVSESEELARVVPVVEALVKRFDALVSVDTSTPAVMRESAQVGAGFINDVRALNRPGATETAVELGLPVCIMHMQGAPQTMQDSPVYTDVISEVKAFFQEKIEVCLAAGIRRDNLVLDPGFGFGKALSHNFKMLAKLRDFECFDLPLLIGFSRKTMFGQLLDRSVDQRLAGSLAGALLAAQRGAQIVRVHDVAETVDVLKVLRAVNDYVEL